MEFKVVARYQGDSVEFYVEAGDVKDALVAARTEAHRIFGYSEEVARHVSVSVKPTKE